MHGELRKTGKNSIVTFEGDRSFGIFVRRKEENSWSWRNNVCRCVAE
jgi:hypothetical protein